jgi:hypothetical protein
VVKETFASQCDTETDNQKNRMKKIMKEIPCTNEMYFMCCRMPCDRCFEAGRHHPWCRTCMEANGGPGPDDDEPTDGEAIDAGGDAAEAAWGPSPTDWLLEVLNNPVELVLPELFDEDLAELIRVNDDVTDPDNNVINESDGMESSILDIRELGFDERRAGQTTPIPEEDDDDFSTYSDGVWLSAKKLADALTKHARESGSGEPPMSPMTMSRAQYGEVKEECSSLMVNVGASSSTDCCDCDECKERFGGIAPEETQDRVSRAVVNESRTPPLVVHCEPKSGRAKLGFEGVNSANPRDCTCGPCVAKRARDLRPGFDMADVIVIDSPSSPDSESDREWALSDSSDDDAPLPYQPIMSPITPEATSPGGRSDEKWLVASPSQRYWTEGYGPMRGQTHMPARRVALIRPQTGRTSNPVTARSGRAGFRVTTQAPILQTRTVISRIMMRDGSLMEESLQDRFVMVRTVATETWNRARGDDAATASAELISDEETDRGESMMDIESVGTPLQDE